MIFITILLLPSVYSIDNELKEKTLEEEILDLQELEKIETVKEKVVADQNGYRCRA